MELAGHRDSLANNRVCSDGGGEGEEAACQHGCHSLLRVDSAVAINLATYHHDRVAVEHMKGVEVAAAPAHVRAPALHEPGSQDKNNTPSKLAQHTGPAQNYHNSCNALIPGVQDDWSVFANHSGVAVVPNLLCYAVGSMVGCASVWAPVAGLAV